MNKQFRKSISCITLILFIFGMVFSMPLPSSAAITSPYSDVSVSDWSFKYVAKMNMRNVVAGYPDGTFKPNNAVTQLEAVLMAVRNMEVDAKLAQINTNRTLPFSVPEWVEKQAKKELLFAIDNGLIVTAENDFNASSLASRAWITRLMVRMIGKDSEAALNSNIASDFTDAADIPSWAKGYINTAVKYDLISGFPDGSFKPTQNVTRAQTVALLGRSEQHLDLTKTIKGKVLNTSNSGITVLVNGVSNNYIATADSIIYDADNNLTSLGNIKAGQEVLLVAPNYNIKYLEVLSDSASTPVSTVIEGTLIKVLSEQSVIIVKDDEGIIHTKHLAQGVQCLDSAGRIYSLEQVPINSQVTISLDTQGFVNSFILQTHSGQVRDTGIIYEIDTLNNLIILKNHESFSTFEYSNLVEIVVEGVRFATIDDLQPGDEVRLETENNIVTKITLLKSKQELTLTGTVIMNDKDVLVIEKEDGKFETYKVANNCTIEISGIDIPRISDVLIDDIVSLEIEDGVITYIKVTNRSIESKVNGTIVAVDKSSSTLVLETSDEKLKTYVVAKYADIEVDNIKNATLSDLSKGMKVEIELLDDKIIYIANKNTIEGVVLAVNADRNLLSIRTKDEGSVTYRVATNVDIEIEDDPRADLEDIERNDIVEVKIADELITDIYVERTYIYEVTRTYSDYLRVEDEDGDSKYIYDDDKPEIIIPNITKPTIKDFKVGDIIRATYKGFKLTKLELVPAVAGEVVLVNQTGRSISISGFDGKITNLDIGNRLTIKKDGKTYNSLSVLATGDRIKIKQTANNETIIDVMSKLRTQFVDTEKNNTKLYITRNAGISYVVYDIADPCYIHKGNQVYTFNNLREMDWVNIYYLDNVVYEIEKV
ncbi:MAG: S-layer homology domain-containing protein [Syntrophomonadaceae bacterium]|nr:S-layer homology domain-containing protein [Syntrophomonadaceae bacterium]